MKKSNLKKVMSALALTAVAASATSVSAFAQEYTALSESEIAAATVTPTATMTMKVVPLSEAKGEGKTQHVELMISGAEKQYASTGFHIYYDERLTIEEYDGLPMVWMGAAGGKAPAKLGELVQADDPSNWPAGMKGFFVTNDGRANFGLDGVLWEFDVTLPDGLEGGEVFPFDIVYKDTAAATDMFIDVDRKNKAMEGYLFTKGIYSVENGNAFTLAKADKEADAKKCPKLESYNNTGIDGYIAIEGGAVETTTEAPATTTTTEAPVVVTTTTTEAPAVETTTTTKAPAVETTTTTEAEDPAAGSKTTTTGNGQNGANGTNTSTSTKKADGTTTKKADGGKKDESPKTGVAGVGVAAAGLAIAVGTAFALRKKED